MPKDKLDLTGLNNYTPLKITQFDSNGFVTIQDIDGAIDTVLEVSDSDRENAFHDLIRWHLEKARKEICATKENPCNDTRYTNGYHVIRAIEEAIKISNEERKFTAR